MRSDKSDSMNPSHQIQSPFPRTRSLIAPFIGMLFLAAVFASGCVIHDRGHGRGHGRGIVIKPRAIVSVPAPVTFVFTDHHRHAVHDYYRHNPPHHGNKHGHRPPGLHKHDVFPSGIHMQVLPPGLARQLPHPPHDTQYIFYNDQVLLVDVHSHVVLDFIDIGVVVQPRAIVSVPAPITLVFTDHHRHAVHEYYSHNPRHHGKKHKGKKHKGKRGRGHRPPGLHKHDVFPSGVHMQALPQGLAGQLPHPPHGAQYIYHEDQILLIDVHSHVVLDFINIQVGF